MHATGSNAPEGAAEEPDSAGGHRRFDGERARRILKRAAAEQQRLSDALADSYSLEELEEIAAEAGISPEALRTAVDADHADGRRSVAAAAGTPHARTSPAMGGAKRDNWSTPWKVGAAAAAGSLGFMALLLAFPAVAEAVLWALLVLLIVMAVLIVLGAAPF